MGTLAKPFPRGKAQLFQDRTGNSLISQWFFIAPSSSLNLFTFFILFYQLRRDVEKQPFHGHLWNSARFPSVHTLAVWKQLSACCRNKPQHCWRWLFFDSGAHTHAVIFINATGSDQVPAAEPEAQQWWGALIAHFTFKTAHMAWTLFSQAGDSLSLSLLLCFSMFLPK